MTLVHSIVVSDWFEYLFPCLAAVAGGAVNSVAGGGTLLTFPALFSVLGGTAGASVIANATSTVALVPGSAAAMWGYRRGVKAVAHWAWLLIWPSLLGGLIGSLLVAELPPRTFEMLVPWLILTAALLFALQPSISRWLGIGRLPRQVSPRRAAGVALLQFLIAIYGGYFGAGIGILMLSGLANDGPVRYSCDEWPQDPAQLRDQRHLRGGIHPSWARALAARALDGHRGDHRRICRGAYRSPAQTRSRPRRRGRHRRCPLHLLLLPAIRDPPPKR